MSDSAFELHLCITYRISIVESIPQNLTYKPDEYIHPSTYSGLKALLELAKESVHIASYYWTLRGPDVDFYDETADEVNNNYF